MSAGIYNLEILQGETFEKRITWKDQSGNVVDLSGYSAKMQIRNSKSQTAPLIVELSTTNGKIVIVDNVIIITIAASETASMNFTIGYYDLELTKASVVKRLLQGSVTLDVGVTI